MHLLEVYCLFSITVYTVSKVFPISDASNITPTTISARPVLDNVDEPSETDAVDVSRRRESED